MADPLRIGSGALIGALCLVFFATGPTGAQSGTAAAPRASSGEYKIYALRHKPAEEMERSLSATLPELGEQVHVVADARANQILLRGSSRAQQLTRQMLDALDKPTPPKAPTPASNERPVLQMYPAENGKLADTAARLRKLFPDENQVRIASEAGSNQLIVVAPPTVHGQISNVLGQAVGDHPVGLHRQAPPDEPAPLGEFVVRLVNAPVRQVETSLLKILGARLEPMRVAQRQTPIGYRMQSGTGEWTDLLVNEQDNSIAVRGQAELSRQLARLVQALDTRGRNGRQTTRIVPFHLADPNKVKQALDAYRGQAPPGSPGLDRPATRGGAWPNAVPRMPHQESRAVAKSGIVLVAHIFQQTEDVEGLALPLPGDAAALPDDEGRLQELGMEVEVETLPDLDIVILRGRDRDVEELARIIEELERLSAEAEPEIEIYPLKHVNGNALVEIIDDVSDDLVGGRQGRISVISLEKPNALLLIGWGEALSTTKELIKKLDRPVAPETQLQVFALKHAPVEQLENTITDFFDDRDGLGPQLIVSADSRSNSLIIQASPRDMAEVKLLIERLDTATTGAVNQARMFEIKNALAEDLADTLEDALRAAEGGTDEQRSAILEFLSIDDSGARLIQSGILSEIQITPNGRSNTILITAPAESMELLAALIERLDSPVDVAQIKVFRVLNGDANSLIQMLRSLFPALTSAAQGPNLATAEGETSLIPLRFSVDSRSNSIIATGSDGDLQIIEALLLRLDEKGLNLRKNQVYRLKNAPAAQVATAINEFLASERIVQQAAPGVVSPLQQIEREVVVVPEEVSNSLILSSTPRFFDEIAALIEQLDEEPPQVLIQVLIAEVELDNTDEFGIEMGLQDSVLFDRSLLGELLTISRSITSAGGQQLATEDVIVGATNQPGFNFNSSPLPELGNSGSTQALSGSNLLGTQGLTNFAVGRSNDDLGFGGLVLSASSESVSILIRALQESRRVEVLSRPQIRTLDNQSAFIQIGERVPYITSSNVTGNGIISNATELIDVGLILGVTPRISPDGLVVMEIDAEKSKLGAESEGITILVASDGTVVRSPRINTTFAQATVSAADGETIILGGLIQTGSATIERRVPYLADVPVLGHLFRYDAAVGEKKELLLILTPHIIRGPEDSERIKQLETARMSWCCADVHAVHGVDGLCNVTDCAICDGNVPVVYPDFDPRGVQPSAVTPAVPGGAPAHPQSGPIEFIPPGNALPDGASMPPIAPHTDARTPSGYRQSPPSVFPAENRDATMPLERTEDARVVRLPAPPR